MKVAKKQADGEARRRRPEPARTGPIRSAAASARPKPASSELGGDPPPVDTGAPDSEVQRVIADAVRLGYDVIGQNLQQGRAAADRFSAGAYGVKHAKDDVGALGGRLVQLARDLSTVSFDLAAAVLRDPILHEALKPKPPTPGDKPGDDSPGGAPVNVGCQVRGNDKASAAPFVLSQPERPSRLSAAGLYSPDRSLPPITNLTFLASDDGASIIAVITVPADQPAGTYSGVVCDEETHAPLGTLSVKVAP